MSESDERTRIDKWLWAGAPDSEREAPEREGVRTGRPEAKLR